MSKFKAVGLAVLAVAAGIRIWGLGFGLPAVYHQDEPILMHHALAAAADMGRPSFYVLPALPMYLIDAGVGVYYLIQKFIGNYVGPESLLSAFLADPTAFYWIARMLLGVLPGVVTVWVAMRIARRLGGGDLAALMSGVFVALSPLAVQHSHYAYADTLVALALTFYLLACIRLAASPGARAATVVGMAMGLAAACKYNAVFYAPAAAAAWWACRARPDRWKTLLLMAAAAAALFFISAPYTLLDSREAMAQIFRQAGATEAPGFIHHIAHSLSHGLHEWILLTALIGSVVLLKDRIRRAEAWVLLIYVISGLLSLAFFSQQFARYALPLVPALSVLAGIAVGRVAHNRFWLGVTAGIALTFPLVLSSGDLLRLLAAEDTRTICQDWFESQVPAGTIIARDHTFFSPPLRQDSGFVRAEAASGDPVRRHKAEVLARVNSDRSTYRIYTIRPTPNFAAPFLGQRPLVDATYAALAAEGVEYVVFNGSDRTADILRLREAFACAPPVAVFNPFYGDRTASSDSIESTAAPLRRQALKERKRLGPYLEVYRVAGVCKEGSGAL